MSLIQERLKLSQNKKLIRTTFISKHTYRTNHWSNTHKQGAASLRKIKSDIKKNSQLKDFWQGHLNEQLMVSTEALVQLKTFFTNNMFNNLAYFKHSDTEKLTPDSVIMFIYNKWLQLALYEERNLHPFDAQALKATQKAQFKRDTLDVRTFAIEVLAHHLETKKTSYQDDKESLDKLEREIKADFAKTISSTFLKVGLEDLRLNFFQVEEFITTVNILIDIGNIIGVWDLCFIANVVVPYREENPFADINEWRRALEAEATLALIDTHYPKHKHDRDFVNTMVVISLMRDSYVLSEKIINFVLDKLNQPTKLTRCGGQIVIRYPDGANNERDIFISLITEYYLRQYYRVSDEENLPYALSINLGDEDFYKRIGKSKHTLKLEGFKSWKHSLACYLKLDGHLPGLMIAYFSGEFESHPLKPNVVNRLFAIENPQPSAQQSGTSGFAPQNFAQNKRLARSFLWSALRKSLDLHHIPQHKAYEVHKGVQDDIQKIIDHPAIKPNEKIIAQYAQYLIDKQPITQTRFREGIRKGLSPSVTLTQIDAFGLPLIAVMNDENIITISAHQRQNAYLDMLEIESVDRARVLYYLKFFEDWLIKQFKLQKVIDYDELFGNVKRPSFKVDANVLSFEEYQQALDILIEAFNSEADFDKALPFIQSALLLIMGFKLDLRRSEGLHLKGNDYFYDDLQPDLFIRPHDGRTLKTLNAKRLFHLEEHLNEQELNLFKNYFAQMHIKFGTPPTNFLAQSISTVQPPHKLIPVLMEVLHHVTNDKSIKYHNLRHSKASWEMLAILNAQFQLDIQDQFFQHRPQTAKFLEEGRLRWEQIIHNPHSIHKANYHLKNVMGHGSFTTTLKNYIHTLDIAGAGFQRKKALQTLTLKWATDQGIASKSTLYRKQDDSSDTIMTILNMVMPWPNKAADHTSLSKDVSVESISSATAANQVASSHLLPERELEIFKPYCLFKLAQPMSQEDTHHYLAVLGLESSELDLVIRHFEVHTKFRMKPLTQDASQRRLVQRLHDLPAGWLKAILDGSFFHDDNYINERQLIHTFTDRLSIRLGKGEADPLPRVESFDVLCHHFNHVEPILKLLNLLNASYSFKFQAPTSQKVTLEDWRRALDINTTFLPDSCLQKTTVLNPNGRLIIKIERNNKTRAKDSETYFLLTMLHSYQTFLARSTP